jgi:L-rhamnose mutarotase
MKSVGIILKLRPGCYGEYKKRHDELWPEMAEAMKCFNISSAIYRHDDLLFVHEQAPSEESFQKMGEHPVTPRWNKYMADVLETDTSGEIVFVQLPAAFTFGVFKE